MLVDILIIVLAIFSLYRGREIGFSRQLLSTAGFIGGLFIGAWLQPHVSGIFSSQNTRVLAAIVTTLGCALLLLVAGEAAGLHVKYRIVDKHWNVLDNAMGAVLSFCTLLVGVWLSAALISNLPYQNVQSSVHSSRIVRLISTAFPNAPNVIVDLGKLVDPNGFPQVFIGAEPAPQSTLNLPSLGVLQRAVSKDRLSVVRIEGQGCGGVVEGSGFIAGKDLVITNAHVVAGLNKPTVQDSRGSHDAYLVSFDPKLDLAILHVKDITAPALVFAGSSAQNGTAAAVLGYPGGGSFDAKSAVVTRQITAIGKDIYGHNNTIRDIYEIGADVIPGNSGGPLVDVNGNVIGVVFAQSTSYTRIGYALTPPKVVAELKQVSATSPRISSGKCAE